jgi:molybdopterin synthase catalytic subunit
MIRVQHEDFDLGSEIAALTRGNTRIGGLATFVGIVRDVPMTLEHYPGMTERKLAEIEEEARKRWHLEASLVVHRYGRLEPGAQIVLVATAAEHRAAALESCQFLIDWLKTKAPFWKLEERAGGLHWVEARESDDKAAGRW